MVCGKKQFQSHKVVLCLESRFLEASSWDIPTFLNEFAWWMKTILTKRNNINNLLGPGTAYTRCLRPSIHWSNTDCKSGFESSEQDCWSRGSTGPADVTEAINPDSCVVTRLVRNGTTAPHRQSKRSRLVGCTEVTVPAWSYSSCFKGSS